MARYLILGASGGIGQALAWRLAAPGVTLHLMARRQDGLTDARAALAGTGATVEATAVDARDADALADAVRAAVEAGPLDGLAYAVGTIELVPLARVEPARLLDAFRLDAVGALVAVQTAAPALRAGEGSVVLFSTVAVAQGFAGHAVVSAAKGAVEGLTRALAAELAPQVRVNAVAPSLTRTGLSAPLLANPSMGEAIARLHAIPRLGAPEDAAAAAAFLLGRESGWITGQVVAVDGGRSRVRAKG